MLYKDLYPDLTQIVKGSTWKKLFNWFYLAGMLRYFNKHHLNSISGQFGTHRKINKMVLTDYLTPVNEQFAYKITDKTRAMLKAEGYNTDILADNLTGGEVKHELLVSDVLAKIMREPHFFAAFYYDFGFLRPDACLILKKDRAYKIVFLEVEADKENQLEYLKDKRDKYDKLAKDDSLYSVWWKEWSKRLGLPYCQREDFCFSVLCNSQICKQWEGWNIC